MLRRHGAEIFILKKRLKPRFSNDPTTLPGTWYLVCTSPTRVIRILHELLKSAFPTNCRTKQIESATRITPPAVETRYVPSEHEPPKIMGIRTITAFDSFSSETGVNCLRRTRSVETNAKVGNYTRLNLHCSGNEFLIKWRLSGRVGDIYLAVINTRLTQKRTTTDFLAFWSTTIANKSAENSKSNWNKSNF